MPVSLFCFFRIRQFLRIQPQCCRKAGKHLRHTFCAHDLLPVLPDDLEITGNGKYISRTRRNRNLTLIDNRLDEMCQLGLQTLLGLIDGRKPGDTGLVLLAPQMLKKENGGL